MHGTTNIKLLSLHGVKVKGEENVKQYYVGGNHAQKNINSKANFAAINHNLYSPRREFNAQTRVWWVGISL